MNILTIILLLISAQNMYKNASESFLERSFFQLQEKCTCIFLKQFQQNENPHTCKYGKHILPKFHYSHDINMPFMTTEHIQQAKKKSVTFSDKVQIYYPQTKTKDQLEKELKKTERQEKKELDKETAAKKSKKRRAKRHR